VALYKTTWMTIQFIAFFAALAVLGYLILREWRLMRKIKPELEKLHKGSNSAQLDNIINNIFSDISLKYKYAQQWKRYFERVSQKNADERIRIEPYLGSEVLHYHIGHRAWVDVMGGLFVSLGVLGTFVGLVFGLSHLDLSTTDTLKTSIRQLLSGMESAFYTSIVGIAASMLWSMLDRFSNSRILAQIDWHAERLDFLLNADDEELFLNRLEKVSRNQADHLKTLLTDALEKAMRPIADLIQQQVKIAQNQSQDITKNLVDQITGGTEQTVKSLAELINQSQSSQTNLIDAVDAMLVRYQSMQDLQDESLKQFSVMSEKFYKIVQDSITMSENFSDVGSKVGKLQEQLLLMQEIQQKLLPELSELRKQTNDVVKESLEKSEYYLNRVEHQIGQMQKHWQDTNEQMKVTREVLSVSVKDFAENIDNGLGKTYQHFDNTLTKAMQGMAGSLNRMQELQEELIEVFEELGEILVQHKEAAASVEVAKP
jgi:hypothetical protein